jgi:hypothetical protein
MLTAIVFGYRHKAKRLPNKHLANYRAQVQRSKSNSAILPVVTLPRLIQLELGLFTSYFIKEHVRSSQGKKAYLPLFLGYDDIPFPRKNRVTTAAKRFLDGGPAILDSEISYQRWTSRRQRITDFINGRLQAYNRKIGTPQLILKLK